MDAVLIIVCALVVLACAGYLGYRVRLSIAFNAQARAKIASLKQERSALQGQLDAAKQEIARLAEDKKRHKEEVRRLRGASDNAGAGAAKPKPAAKPKAAKFGPGKPGPPADAA